MRTAPFLTILGVAQIILGCLHAPWGLLAVWSGMCFVVIGIAYAKHWAGVFGKRPNGTLPLGRVCLLFPYLLLTWIVWYLDTHGRRENIYDEIAPNLWLGPWPMAGSLPPGVARIVDLTSEFVETGAVRAGRVYFLLPTLDATPPDREAALRIANLVANNHEPTYVHCALGHGRSALIAALILIERGDAADAADALSQIRRVRPGVKLNSIQQSWLRNAAQAIQTKGATG